MADHPLTLQVPEHLYERLRQMAEAAEQPVEATAIRQLESAVDAEFAALPQDMQQEVAALGNLSDDALWTMAGEQMPRSLQERLSLLLESNKHGTLTADENAELDSLLDRGDRLMLRKAEAAAILTRRGFKVTPNDLAGNHE